MVGFRFQRLRTASLHGLLFAFFVVWCGCGMVLVAFYAIPPGLSWSHSICLFLAGLLCVLH